MAAPSNSVAGEDLFEKVTFELTLNDQEELAWEDRRKGCYRQMEQQVQEPWDRTSLMFMNRDKVSVGGTKWEQGRVWHDGETGRGQIMQGWWKAGFYSPWLTYRRILSRGEIRLLSSVIEGVKVGSRHRGRKISFLQLLQRIGGLNAA